MTEEENAAEDEEDVLEDADVLAEAMTSEEEESVEGEEQEGEDLDPLAEEMLKMMEGEDDADQSDSQEDVDRMMEMEMLKAMEEEGRVGALGEGEGGGLGLGGAGQAAAGGISPNIARLMDVNLSVTIELGRAKQTLEEVMAMGEQSLVELNKQVGEPVDILVNGKLFARGEVVTVSENFGVRITEILKNVSEL